MKDRFQVSISGGLQHLALLSETAIHESNGHYNSGWQIWPKLPLHSVSENKIAFVSRDNDPYGLPIGRPKRICQRSCFFVEI